MRARVLFFGMLKELAGRAAEDAVFPEGADLRAVFDYYAGQIPAFRQLAPSIVVARNQEFADLSVKLSDGDEVAFLPPVSGGSGESCGDGSGAPEPREIAGHGHYFALVEHPIDTRAVIARLLTGAEGAVVTFEGTVRNNTNGRPTLYLDYECYPPMALKMMAKIGREATAAHPVTAVAIVHRLGRMVVGETSVAVIVTAPHRRPAFEAALEGIDRLKRLVPIWKKERFVDGEVWVEGVWDREIPVAG